jgi:hypothetical protein
LDLSNDILVSNFAFKLNLYHYDGDDIRQWLQDSARTFDALLGHMVGLCMLNQVDPYPITYSLSNP